MTDSQHYQLNQLSTWIEAPEWDPAQLVRWLQGEDSPYSSLPDPPYICLLRCIPMDSRRSEIEQELGKRLSIILDAQPDVKPIGRHPEEFLFNLFMLCSCLAQPQSLGLQLVSIYERHCQSKSPILASSWNGISMSKALFNALTTNQIDTRLRDEWLKMIGGVKDSIFIGTFRDGFEAILGLPPDEGYSHKPNLGTIAIALSTIVSHQHQSSTRRECLISCLNDMMLAYPVIQQKYLIETANEFDWPLWAQTCLPTLFIIESKNRRTINAYIWQFYYGLILTHCGCNILKTFCREGILLIDFPASGLPVIKRICSKLEMTRKLNPYSSDTSIVATIEHELRSLEDSAEGSVKQTVSKNRKALQGQLAIMF